MGVEPTWNCFAGRRRTVWLQRQLLKCPRWESNPGFDLRRVHFAIRLTSVKISRTGRRVAPAAWPPRDRGYLQYGAPGPARLEI